MLARIYEQELRRELDVRACPLDLPACLPEGLGKVYQQLDATVKGCLEAAGAGKNEWAKVTAQTKKGGWPPHLPPASVPCRLPEAVCVRHKPASPTLSSPPSRLPPSLMPCPATPCPATPCHAMSCCRGHHHGALLRG